MKIIDLTHLIDEKIQLFPGTKPPQLYRASSIEQDKYRATVINIQSHVGTHMDAPAHMIEEGSYLEDMELSHFIGKAIKIDLTCLNTDSIEKYHLEKYEEHIKRVDFVLFHTGWSQYWGQEKYCNDFPTMTIEAARYMTSFKLKGLGFDVISVDPIDSIDYPIHQIILEKNMVIIENLKNLETIDGQEFIFCALPMKYRKSDGSQVRAAAIYE